MAISLSFLLLLLTSITASPPMPMPSPLASPPMSLSSASPPSPAAAPPPREQQQQLNNIIDALIGTGDFGGWGNLLSSADPSTLPITATFFIPSDNATAAAAAAATTNTLDPLIFPYHIVPQRLSFSDLQRFTTHSRLPTLLPTMSILITNNTPSNFTIDDSPITHPDLYLASAVSVHGVASVLDYSLYGNETFPLKPSRPPEVGTAQPTPPPPPPPSMAGETWGRRRSDAACLCTEYPIVFSVVCAAFAFKIHRIPLSR
ncbi:hypothetical protein PVL29_013526 [Vitis rotundifolia]|uniref:FAS1 domain-containing protein n=1 Tax=Vitis rotundifolia TaxID=103349 RepID=A0AA38ZM62_VITRO|nr:hypothetical protein PVL29_013526 [Vitis rotundifolia]